MQSSVRPQPVDLNVVQFLLRLRNEHTQLLPYEQMHYWYVPSHVYNTHFLSLLVV